jgi:TPR repeat protein
MEKPSSEKTSPPSPVSNPETASPNPDFGNAEVQFNLGLKFAADKGAAQDYGQAAEWYRKAAAQNHCLAQFNLGVMYAQGQGVARDAAQSAVWFDRAAKQGDAGAQFHLGDSCQRASFKQASAEAAESRIEAYKWYRLAAAQGYGDSAEAWTNLTINMTRADVTAGNQRVAAFEIGKPNSPQG